MLQTDVYRAFLSYVFIVRLHLVVNVVIGPVTLYNNNINYLSVKELEQLRFFPPLILPRLLLPISLSLLSRF